LLIHFGNVGLLSSLSAICLFLPVPTIGELKYVQLFMLYRIAKDVVEGPSRNLLEAVAHRIASATLLKFPQISAVRVKVGKPHVAVQGIVDYLGVEILRYRKDVGGDRQELH
jgi:hypothetical protein